MTAIKQKAALLLFSLLAIVNCQAQTTKIKEYLSIPGPISIGNVSYNLVWTSHPNDAYYKQEYVPKGENAERFKKLVMVEVLTGNATVKELAGNKINELKEMKASNPVINYDVFEKNGEIMIDFILSVNAADRKSIEVVERSVYRYRSTTEKSGKKCVLLFAAVERAYGKEATKFLADLKARKSELVNQVAAYKMPAVSIKK